MNSDSSEFFSHSAFPVSGSDVVPGDLVNTNAVSERWAHLNSDSYDDVEYGDYTASSQRNSWSGVFASFRTGSPRPTQLGTRESPYVIEESTFF